MIIFASNQEPTLIEIIKYNSTDTLQKIEFKISVCKSALFLNMFRLLKSNHENTTKKDISNELKILQEARKNLQEDKKI